MSYIAYSISLSFSLSISYSLVCLSTTIRDQKKISAVRASSGFSKIRTVSNFSPDGAGSNLPVIGITPLTWMYNRIDPYFHMVEYYFSIQSNLMETTTNVGKSVVILPSHIHVYNGL